MPTKFYAFSKQGSFVPISNQTMFPKVLQYTTNIPIMLSNHLRLIHSRLHTRTPNQVIYILVTNITDAMEYPFYHASPYCQTILQPLWHATRL